MKLSFNCFAAILLNLATAGSAFDLDHHKDTEALGSLVKSNSSRISSLRSRKNKDIDPVLGNLPSLQVSEIHRAAQTSDEWIQTGFIPGTASKMSLSSDRLTYAMSGTDKVTIYSFVNNVWIETSAIEAPEGVTFYENSLLSGDASTVVISCHNDSFNMSLRVYRFSDGSWSQIGGVINGEAYDDRWGQFVISYDGNIVAHGAIWNSGNAYHSGHARVFTYSNGNWNQLGSDIDGVAPNDIAGMTLALSGDTSTIAVGARDHNQGRGQVRIFRFINNTWQQLGGEIEGYQVGDRLSRSISLSRDGNTVAIGADHSDPNGVDQSGHAEVHRYSNGSWNMLGSKFLGRETYRERYGDEVSLSADGNIFAVSAYWQNEQHIGYVDIFEYSSGVWSQLGSSINGENEGDYVGAHAASLTEDGQTIVVSSKDGYTVYSQIAPSDAPSLPPSIGWDGTWFISYDSPADLSGKVLTTTYSTNPISDDNVVVTLTDGSCDSGATGYDDSVITGFTVDVNSGTLLIPKTIDPAVIAADHSEGYDFCETVTLKEDGWEMVYSQTQFTLTASFLEEIESYTATLEEDTVVNDEGDVSLDLEGTVIVTRCGGASDNLNPGDRLCLEIYEEDTPGVVVDSINDLNLQQGAILFEAVSGGSVVLINLVEESCENGSCTVYISLPAGLFADDTDADTLTLNISGDVYLKEEDGKDSKGKSTGGFVYSVQLQKPCEGTFLHGFLNKLLSF